MKISTLIEDARRYVVGYYEDEDEKYVHWTEDDWLSYVRLAVGVIAMVDVEMFTKVIDVELQPGQVQELPDSCETLRSVRGQRKDDGTISHFIRKRSYNSLRIPRITRPTCKATTVGDGSYKVESYAVDDNDKGMVIVDPPVPVGFTGSLVVTCYSPPKIDSLDEDLPFDDSHATIVFELILYYAWGVDIEDNANRERSNTHWNNALKLMDIRDVAQQRALLRKVQAARNG